MMQWQSEPQLSALIILPSISIDHAGSSAARAMLAECFAYDDVLRKNRHFAGGEALQSPRNAITLDAVAA
jgi:hypothetical protein